MYFQAFPCISVLNKKYNFSICDRDCNQKQMCICFSGGHVEQAQYCAQVPSYSKTLNFQKNGLLSDVSVGSNLVNQEQEFQMFPKTQLEALNVNYCSTNQDFTRNNLNLMLDNTGKIDMTFYMLTFAYKNVIA